jgi:hypothetical protein
VCESTRGSGRTGAGAIGGEEAARSCSGPFRAPVRRGGGRLERQRQSRAENARRDGDAVPKSDRHALLDAIQRAIHRGEAA